MDSNSGLESFDPRSGDLADLSRQFAKFGEAQAEQTRILGLHTGKFNALESAANRTKLDLFAMGAELRGFRAEASGKFEVLDRNFVWLRQQFTAREGVLTGPAEDVTQVREEIKILTTDVTQIKDDVTVLEVKVDALLADMADVKGSLKEILDRLPAKAA